jgi:hypothetical protein
MNPDDMTILIKDEKGEYVLLGSPQPQQTPASRRHRPLAFGLLSVFLLCWLTITSGYGPSRLLTKCHTKQETATWQERNSAKALVPLEAHIMSKCGDARDCLRDLVLPTMQRVYDKVNFTLSYIGT